MTSSGSEPAGDAPVVTGTRIADYVLERQIGRGGMAVVYLAHDLRLDRPVALKLLAPELAGNAQFRARFARESHVAAAIDHPNIVPIYEADEFEDQLYIAMRYVEGRDLGDLLAESGPLPIGRANRIFTQVAAALDVAHRHDLVHRDVKPANILITSAAPGDPDHVYLTDFGLTKRSLSLSGFTSVGNFVGSIDYVSPEQITGRPVDGRADVYALGCVIFEALAGVAPFQRDVDLAVLWAHLTDPPLAFPPYRPDLPPEVGEVLAVALAKAPEERYATCTELVTAIRDVVSAAAMSGQVQVPRPSDVLRTVPPQPSGPSGSPTGPYPQQSPVAVVPPRASPADPPGHAAGSVPGRSAPNASPPAPPPAPQHPPRAAGPIRGRRRVLLAVGLAVVLVAGALGGYLGTRGGGSVPGRHYAGSAASPAVFDYPGNWSALTHTTVFTLVSPASRDLESLFATAPGGDWTVADRLIHSDPGRVTGLYTGLNETLDPAAASSILQENLRFTLPGEVTYTSGTQPATVAGAKAAKLSGSVSGPRGDQLQFTSYIVARPSSALYLTFFCVPRHCDNAALDRILTSVRLTASSG